MCIIPTAQTNIHTYIHTYIETDKQTDRQRDREMNGWMNSQMLIEVLHYLHDISFQAKHKCSRAEQEESTGVFQVTKNQGTEQFQEDDDFMDVSGNGNSTTK